MDNYGAAVLADSPSGYFRLADATPDVLAVTAKTTAGAPAVQAIRDIGNGTHNGQWVSNGADLPTWLRVHLASAKVVTGYSFIGSEYSNGRSPSSFTFQGSNDGTTWAVLDTRSGVGWTLSERKTYTFANTTAYVYYQIVVTYTTGGSYTTIGGLRLIGDLLFEVVDETGTANGVSYSDTNNTYGPTRGGPPSSVWSTGASVNFAVQTDNEHIDLPSCRLNGSKFSMEAWVKTTDDQDPIIFTNRWWGGATGLRLAIANSADLGSPTTGTLMMVVDGDGIWATMRSNVVVNDGAWHHVVGVLDATDGVAIDPATQLRVYVDGVPHSDVSYNYSSATAPLVGNPLGTEVGYNAYVGRGFSGSLAEVAVWTSTALSDAQVAAHYLASQTTHTSAESPVGVSSPSVTHTIGETRTTGLSAVAVGSLGQVQHLTTTGTSPVTVSSSGHVGDYLTLSMTAGSGWAFGPLSPFVGIELDLFAGSDFDLHLPVIPTADPITGKTPYRLVVTLRDGSRLAELTDATITNVVTSLNTGGQVDFSLPNDSPQAAWLLPVAREVQVWRGTRLIDTFVLLKGSSDGVQISFSCPALHWYFTRRVIGKIPTPNLLLNGSFDLGEKYWNFSYVKSTKPGQTSIPPLPPVHSISHTAMFGKNSLRISGSNGVALTKTSLAGDTTFDTGVYTLTSSGIAAINAICAGIHTPAPHMTCIGNTDNVGDSASNYTLGLNRANSVRTQILTRIPGAVVSVVSYGETRPVASNSTPTGRARNRRVDIQYSTIQIAKGHRQYAGQTFRYTNPSSAVVPRTLMVVGWCNITQFLDVSKDGWAVYMQLRRPTTGAVIAVGNTTLDSLTPRGVWNRYECTLDVPADNVNYYVDVRLYPPSGTCLWDEISVTAANELAFFNTDEASIVKGLVVHAQDTAMGKSSLNIGTNCPATGVRWTRQYPYDARQLVSDAMAEFPTLAGGLDFKVVNTPTSRTLTTYHPRKGKNRGVVLALGGNLETFTWDVDGSEVSTTVVVQANGQGSGREEGVVQDASLMGGLVLEKVYSFTPLSSVATLHAQALTGWHTYNTPVKIPSVVMKAEYTDDLLARVSEGDVVTVQISKGWIQVNALYRITSQALNPDYDQLTYTLVPEVPT